MRLFGRVLLIVSALAIAGCADQPTPTIPAGPAPVTAPTTSAAPTVDPTFGDQTPNSRGNLVKMLGQPAAQTVDTSSDPVLEFRVDDIRQNAECEADGYTDEPDNEQFLAVDVFARTTPQFDPATSDSSLLSAYNWTVVTADGVRHLVDTGPAYGCSPRSGQNLGNLTPGITVTGTFLLDAPADLNGAVLVLQSPLMTDGGWEWPIPAA